MALTGKFWSNLSYGDFRTAFTSNDGRQDFHAAHYCQASAALGTGAVVASVLTLPLRGAPGSFSGGPEHRALCSLCAEWLRQQGHDQQGETWYVGGRSDLTAPKAKIAVECGGTRLEKVMTALKEGWQVLLAPYPDGLEALGLVQGEALLFEHRQDFPFGLAKPKMRAAMDALARALTSPR